MEERLRQAWTRFQQLNRQYFQGQLRLDKLTFNQRFRNTLGAFSINGQPRWRLIELSAFYLEAFGWNELEKVLLHEMVHLLLNSKGHGPKFKAVQTRIEAQYGSIEPKPIPVKLHKYVYACNRCGLRIGRWKEFKGKYIHKNCGGRFRLKKIQPNSVI